MRLEGIVGKRRGRPYRSGRSPDWIKVKNADAPGGEPHHGVVKVTVLRIRSEHCIPPSRTRRRCRAGAYGDDVRPHPMRNPPTNIRTCTLLASTDGTTAKYWVMRGPYRERGEYFDVQFADIIATITLVNTEPNYQAMSATYATPSAPASRGKP